SWGYYGERATTYLFGQKLAIPFRLIWVVMIFVGSFQEIEFVWRLGDIFNAAMALPNLIALVALSGVGFALAKGDKKAAPDHEMTARAPRGAFSAGADLACLFWP